MFDPEIEAIAKCYDLIKVLEDDSKIRVIQWLVSRFELNPQPSTWNGHSSPARQSSQNRAVSILPPSNNDSDLNGGETLIAVPQENTIESFDSVAEIFASTSPNNDWEKALVVAAFSQVKNALSDFTSYEINKELKNLGHASSNITKALDNCIDRKPQLILQLKKVGKSRQAKKKYKVSNEGLMYVKSMIGR